MNKKIIYILAVIIIALGAWYLLNNKMSSTVKNDKPRDIYVINPGGETFTIFLENFLSNLKVKYPDGDINIVYKDSEGDKDKLESYINEAISKNPAFIATISAFPTIRLLEKTQTIPILTALGDPIEHGYIKSLQGSEINLAGISQQSVDLTPKRIELLKKAVPSIKKIAIVYDTTCGPTKKARPIANAQAPQLGITFVEFPLANPTRDDLSKTLEKISKKDFDALMFYPHGTLFSKADLFLKRAKAEKLPMIMPDSTSLKDGAFASYGPNYSEMGISLGRIADKILAGTNPGIIPWEQPETIAYTVNITNAEALGIKLTPDTLSAATSVQK